MCLLDSGAFGRRLQGGKHRLPLEPEKPSRTNMQYVVWRRGAAAGRNQEVEKRKQGEVGRQRGLLYTLTHVGDPALKTFPKHTTPL